MSAEFYNRMAATAERLMGNYGNAVSIKRETGGTFDPVTGATTAGTLSTFTPKGIFQRIPNNLIDGTRIKASDRMLVVDSSYVGMISDKVVIDSQDWSIAELREVKPNGSNNVVTFLTVRR